MHMIIVSIKDQPICSPSLNMHCYQQTDAQPSENSYLRCFARLDQTYYESVREAVNT